MDNDNKKRYYEIDVIKVSALWMVISLHFIKFSSGWLKQINSPLQILAIALFLISDCCVPLFFLCSGFLLHNRDFSWKQHYCKLGRILLMYIFASFLCGIYRVFIIGDNLKGTIIGVFTFSTAPYSWYIKYYIVLFLFIPILNLIYSKIKFKKVLLLVIFGGG